MWTMSTRTKGYARREPTIIHNMVGSKLVRLVNERVWSIRRSSNIFGVKAGHAKHDQARLHLTNDGTHMRGSSATPPSIAPLMLILLFRLITHHSAPDKKVTVAKDGHTFTQDLMN